MALFDRLESYTRAPTGYGWGNPRPVWWLNTWRQWVPLQRLIRLVFGAVSVFVLLGLLAGGGSAGAADTALESTGDSEEEAFLPVSVSVLFGVLVAVTVFGAVAAAFVMMRRGSARSAAVGSRLHLRFSRLLRTSRSDTQ